MTSNYMTLTMKVMLAMASLWTLGEGWSTRLFTNHLVTRCMAMPSLMDARWMVRSPVLRAEILTFLRRQIKGGGATQISDKIL